MAWGLVVAAADLGTIVCVCVFSCQKAEEKG